MTTTCFTFLWLSAAQDYRASIYATESYFSAMRSWIKGYAEGANSAWKRTGRKKVLFDVEVEIELNLKWLRSEDTKGWVGSHFDIVDKISPAKRPGDTSSYTHKLNFELDTAVNIFNWLPDGNWLRNIELEGSLDYVATGLLRAGDRIGNELFLDNASGWSFSLVFVIPLAPLRP